MRSKAPGAAPGAHIRRRGGIQEPVPGKPAQDAKLHCAGQGFRIPGLESRGLVKPDSPLDVAGDHAVEGQQKGEYLMDPGQKLGPENAART